MARKILIVGAGQSGLQLSLGLLQHGYDVTVMSARTGEEIRNGRVMSTQGMFDTALQHERALALTTGRMTPLHSRALHSRWLALTAVARWTGPADSTPTASRSTSG